MNGQFNVFQSDDMKIIADEFLGKQLGFDHCFGHDFYSSLKTMFRYGTARVSKRRLIDRPLAYVRGSGTYDFGRTFCPFFKSAGGLTIKSSPPINPFETVAPCDDVPANCTWRRRAFPSTTMKTAPSRTAEAGIVISGFPDGVLFSLPRFSVE